MKTFKIYYFIVLGILRSKEVNAWDYRDSAKEFERITSISKNNIIKRIQLN